MLDGLESDTDEEELASLEACYYYVPGEKKGGGGINDKIIHNYFCGNVLLTRTKFSNNHEIAKIR